MWNYRYLVFILIGIYAALTQMKRWDREESRIVQIDEQVRRGEDTRTRNTPGHNRGYTAVRVPVMLLFLIWHVGIRSALQLILDLMPVVALYFACILLLLPWLRRYIRPRACGVLWIYPLMICSASIIIWYLIGMPMPHFLIYVPEKLWWGIALVWAVGAIGVLAYYELQHRIFLRTLKRNFYEADDEAVEILRRESERVGWYRPLPLRITPELTTPLTVGISLKDLAIYLPERSYSREELILIFRHELRHMLRQDNKTKRQWAWIRALFWFNPLVWIAARKAAEDMELACDEFVVKDFDPDLRQYYAQLLLDTAGDSRGYSTCLSARASTLRYRLKCVVAPTQKFSGSIVLACATVFLGLTFSQVSFVSQQGTLGELCQLEGRTPTYIGYEVKDRSLMQVRKQVDEYKFLKEGESQEDLLHDTGRMIAYLESLPVTRLPDRLLRKTPESIGNHVSLRLENSENTCYLTLCDAYLYLEQDNAKSLYRVEQTLDWEWICGNLNLEDHAPEYSLPRMDYWIEPAQANDPMRASFRRVSIDGKPVEPLDEPDIGGYGGLDLSQYDRVTLVFSYPPQEYQVIVSNEAGVEQYRIDGTEIQDYTFDLAEFSAIYTVRGKFLSGEGKLYEMEFFFQVIPKELN